MRSVFVGFCVPVKGLVFDIRLTYFLITGRNERMGINAVGRPVD